jgi:uncharacterized protein YcsI (UPF0317 family)
MFANSDYTQPVNAKRDHSIPVAWRNGVTTSTTTSLLIPDMVVSN